MSGPYDQYNQQGYNQGYNQGGYGQGQQGGYPQQPYDQSYPQQGYPQGQQPGYDQQQYGGYPQGQQQQQQQPGQYGQYPQDQGHQQGYPQQYGQQPDQQGGAPGGAQDGERGLGGAITGGIAGGYAGSKANHGFIGTIAGAVIGSLAEDKLKKHKHSGSGHGHGHGHGSSGGSQFSGAASSLGSLFGKKAEELMARQSWCSVTPEAIGCTVGQIGIVRRKQMPSRKSTALLSIGLACYFDLARLGVKEKISKPIQVGPNDFRCPSPNLSGAQFTELGSNVKSEYDPQHLLRNPPRPSEITLELLLASQSHLGHATALWNPRNSSYIFGVRDGIHIISLEVTAAYLRRAARVVEEVARRAGLILFVGTRPGQRGAVVRAAELAKGYHIFDRWIPGSITNGQRILDECALKVVDEFDNELPEYTTALGKHPVLRPDLVVCLNPLENTAMLSECAAYNIPTIGIIDTDADVTTVTYPIPANDDSLRCVAVIAGALGRAGEAGQKKRMEDARQGILPYKRVSKKWFTKPSDSPEEGKYEE
ncbi:conserved hypothetical protein [Uncinocarpus reesii 1704]|uniref:40S ribosomal protein S2 n=1 Tax=Uncinocarpus reesii (strain UAMH 1704) TaxID=336963 RepID=C4JK18_UNCRE|nr:uncharacterized protein UREG_01975 [Uncinocarpus reesii 1704]EEP77126.1 conserved hypothetical protein [Uncinocarpus reesii 1704]